jgi:lysylphosphatidylglycerol synthetase-like protein (DUF2156 family)
MIVKVILGIAAYLIVGFVWVIRDFSRPIVYRKTYAASHQYGVAVLKAFFWPLFLAIIPPILKRQKQKSRNDESEEKQ